MMNISERAATEMKRYIDERGEPNLAIRVFVQGACGCGSAQYGMGLEDEFKEDEKVLELCGVKFVVDTDSIPYLEGAEIDYSDSLMGKGFTIANPNRATSGCGCVRRRHWGRASNIRLGAGLSRSNSARRCRGYPGRTW